MSELIDLRFHVGALGFARPEKESEALTSIHFVLSFIKDCLQEFHGSANGFTDNNLMIDLYADTRLSGEIWAAALSKESMTLNYIDTGSDKKTTDLLLVADTITSFEGEHPYFDATEMAIDWIAAQSDIIILLQEGEEQSIHQFVRSRLSRYDANVICICINTNLTGVLLQVERYYNEPISLDQLKNYIHSLYNCASLQSCEEKQKPFFLSRLWHGCYQRFIQKYNAGIAYEQDLIETFTGQRRALEEKFRQFDSQANAIAKHYREAIYFRSILPFLSTVFLAIGFYSETLLGTIHQFSGSFSNLWMVVAGAGFFINALISVYAYFMHRSKSIHQNQTEFLTSRYIAEFLRIAKHYHTQGVPVSPYFVSERAQMARARNLLRALAPQTYIINSSNTKSILSETLALIDGQIRYHERTMKRLEKIVIRLKKFHEVVFWIGFGLVLARGLFQILFPFMRPFIQGSFHGTPWENLLRSFANMLALMIPAWAGYFSSKLAINNFKGLFEHSMQMKYKLLAMKHRTEKLSEKNSVPYETLQTLTEDILSMQIDEVNTWYTQTAAITIQRL